LTSRCKLRPMSGDWLELPAATTGASHLSKQS
jgi:hypothetical protein